MAKNDSKKPPRLALPTSEMVVKIRGVMPIIQRKTKVRGLPLTPLHYPLAFIIYKFGGQRLSLPALIVGSMLPDIEIPVILLVLGAQDPHRLVLHSLFGGATIGTVLGVAITVLVYPPLTSAIFRVSESQVKERCRLSVGLAVSCLVGIISHVLLDVTNHLYNPVFWPFLSIYETPSPIVPLLGGEDAASFLMHGLMAVLFAGLLLNRGEKHWEELLVGKSLQRL